MSASVKNNLLSSETKPPTKLASSRSRISKTTTKSSSDQSTSPGLNLENAAINKDNVAKHVSGNNNILELPNLFKECITEVPLTKSLFMEGYSQGSWFLSDIPCPSAFKDCDMMPPPLPNDEMSRLKHTLLIKSNKNWLYKRQEINKLCLKAVKHYQCQGCAISLITEKKQVIMHKINLNLSECSRFISFDGHTILSKDNLFIADCNKDWRTKENPLVKGYPLIATYSGVPIKYESKGKSYNIGCFSLFNDTTANNGRLKNLDYLSKLSQRLMDLIIDSKDGAGEKEKKSHSHKHQLFADSGSATANKLILQNMIGRATSQTSGLSLIFDKDGSGTSYKPNHQLYINYNLLKEKQIEAAGSEEVNKILNNITKPKRAAYLFSKYISKKYGFDYVAIIELRTSQKFAIEAKYCPKKNVFLTDELESFEKLVCLDKKVLKSRVLGGYGCDLKEIGLKNNKILFEATENDFGLIYNKSDLDDKNVDNFAFNSAAFIPFARCDSELERRTKVDDFSLNSNESDAIELKTRSPRPGNMSPGGKSLYSPTSLTSKVKQNQVDLKYNFGCYFISCMSFTKNKVTENDVDLINKVFADTCVYKKLYKF